MQIDIQWLRNNFRLFNKQYFDGVLPEPRFYIGHSRTRLGSLSYKRGFMVSNLHTLNGKVLGRGLGLPNAFTLSMSNYYDQTEYQFKNVLLHEMIHLSIASSGLKDTSSHGVVFRGMMSRLNREGWNISITTPMQGTPKAYTGSSTVIRQYLVLAIEMKDGNFFLSSVNPKFAKAINQRLKRVSEIKHFAWYTTNDKWFEDMPKVRSLRGRKVDAKTFNKKTTAMQSLVV